MIVPWYRTSKIITGSRYFIIKEGKSKQIRTDLRSRLKKKGKVQGIKFIKSGITNSHLNYIRNNYPNIEDLILDDCNKITGVGLKSLKGLKKLKLVSVEGCSNITETDRQELRELFKGRVRVLPEPDKKIDTTTDSWTLRKVGMAVAAVALIVFSVYDSACSIKSMIF